MGLPIGSGNWRIDCRYNWHEEIKEKEFHDKSEGKWYIIGWYADEKQAFEIAKDEWEDQQQKGWDSNSSPTLHELADGSFNLDIVDDYFRWNVITPHWFLHSDGLWGKMLCKDVHDASFTELMVGEYPSLKAAELMLRNTPFKPKRFEDEYKIPYEEHLSNAEPPYSCRKTELSSGNGV